MTRMDTISTLGISSKDINQFEDDGAVCLRGLIDKHWLIELREATERALHGKIMDIGVDPVRPDTRLVAM